MVGRDIGNGSFLGRHSAGFKAVKARWKRCCQTGGLPRHAYTNRPKISLQSPIQLALILIE